MTNPMTSELKPCPFCGEVGILFKRNTHYTVECFRCSCEQSCAFVTEQEAVAAWNTRPTPTVSLEAALASGEVVLRKDVEELVEALKFYAKEENYYEIYERGIFRSTYIQSDRGQKAFEALEVFQKGGE